MYTGKHTQRAVQDVTRLLQGCHKVTQGYTKVIPGLQWQLGFCGFCLVKFDILITFAGNAIAVAC